MSDWDDDDDGSSKQPFNAAKFFKKYGIYILATVVFIFLRPGQPIIEVGKYDLIYFAFLLGFTMFNSSWDLMKWRSPQFVANNIHFSTDAEGFDYGNYTVFSMGYIKFYGAPYWNCKDGTFIAPRTSIVSLGKQVACLGEAVRIPAELIPPAIREQVLMNKELKPPYYRVYASSTVFKRFEEVGQLVKELQEVTRENADLDKILRSKLSRTEYVVSHVGRVNREGVASRAKGWLKHDTRRRDDDDDYYDRR